jgi:hypothetical protein
MIVFGLVLLIIGFVSKIPAVSTGRRNSLDECL